MHRTAVSTGEELVWVAIKLKLQELGRFAASTCSQKGVTPCLGCAGDHLLRTRSRLRLTNSA